jgi:hypothetical protein
VICRQDQPGLKARDRATLLAAFEGESTVEGAWAKIGRRASRATVGRVKKEWEGRGAAVADDRVDDPWGNITPSSAKRGSGSAT